MPKFSSLDLAKPILAALNDEGYHTPTPIQAKSIPPVLEGRDLLGCAQTGTGKTAAFAVPVLHQLHTEKLDKTRKGPRTPRALVLAPTRELANQIDESFSTYGQHTHLRSTPIFGGVSQHHQVRSMVGCLALVGMGRWRVEQVAEALEAKDRQALGLNAPPHGLYFVRAEYPTD